MNTDIKLSNMPSMTINGVVDKLSDMYSQVIKANQPVGVIPSIMLWGPPGVGKSQGVRQIAKRIEENTGKKTSVTDVRLLLFNPIDLRGIPTANADKTLAVWLRPQIFQMDASEDVINILFLDEISAAPQSVQAAAYQITLDRTVGEHKLPENCIVIAAGNRTTDKSVAYKMPKALANRLLHIQVEWNEYSWIEWAEKNGINDLVISYIEGHPDALMQFEASSDQLTFATPRSWEMVSNILNFTGENLEEQFMMIAGLIGVGGASEFLSWHKVRHGLPDVKLIFAGKNPRLPKNMSPDAYYELINQMFAYAANHRGNFKEIGNSIKYAMQFPPDYAVILIQDYMSIQEGYREQLMRIPEFAQWMEKRGSLLNGSV